MFRISLRELLAAVALVAFATVSLKYASEGWVTIVAGLALLAFFAAIIVAVADHGPRQVSAIGFAIVMLVYGLIVMNTPPAYSPPDRPARTSEFDHWEGRLPTTRLLRYVHHVFDASRYVDNTGKEIPNYDPANPIIPVNVGGMGFGPSASLDERPPRNQFTSIGHLWWGLLLGYIGGRFAGFVYARRTREPEN